MLDVIAGSMSTRAIAAETRLSQPYIVNLRLGYRGRVRPSYGTVEAITRLHQKVVAKAATDSADAASPSAQSPDH